MRFPNMNFHTHTTYCDGKETAEQMVPGGDCEGLYAPWLFGAWVQ